MIIRVVDIETTGLDPARGAEVIELGMQVVGCQPDGSEARLTDQIRSWLYRSMRPSPPDVLAVHHILDTEKWSHADLFDAASADVRMSMVAGAADVYAAHNAEFEFQFLGIWSDPEYQTPAPSWICTYKCALRAWPEAPSHGNQALMYWLGLHEELDEGQRHPPHRAGPDAYVTAAVLVRLLRLHDVSTLLQWSSEPRVLPTCPIGKFRGTPWPQVDQGFLSWMLRQPDMGSDLRWNAQREIDRRRTASHRGD